MCKYFLIYTILFLFVGGRVCAQDFKMGYTDPANAANPNYRHVILEIEGVDRTNASSPIPKGLLVARMTMAERNSISIAPSGLLVYVTTDATGFYYNAATSTGTPVWERFLTGSNNSQNGVFTMQDSVFRFDNNAPEVSINTVQNNALKIGKNRQTYIFIPQTMGSASGNTGLAISDNGDLTVDVASLVVFNSTNKGVLLPRVTSLSNIPLPPFGLMVLLLAGGQTDGLYINLSKMPNAPSWTLIK